MIVFGTLERCPFAAPNENIFIQQHDFLCLGLISKSAVIGECNIRVK